MSKRTRSIITAAVWTIGVLIVWEVISHLLADVSKNPRAKQSLPTLEVIFSVLFRNNFFLSDLWVTVSRACVGFVLGVALGFVFAVLLSLSGTLEKIAYPYLLLSQMIPVLGLAPIFSTILRDTNATRVAICTFLTFFPVTTNTLAGLKAVENTQKDLMRSYAANKWTVYRKLMIPASLGSLATGAKIAAPMAVTAAIIVDNLSGQGGIGSRMLYALSGGILDVFWACVIVGAVAGILSFVLIGFIEKIIMPYKFDGVLFGRGRKAVVK